MVTPFSHADTTSKTPPYDGSPARGENGTLAGIRKTGGVAVTGVTVGWGAITAGAVATGGVGGGDVTAGAVAPPPQPARAMETALAASAGASLIGTPPRLE